MNDANNRKILAYLRDCQDDMVEDLKQLIELESPTLHKPSVDKLGGFLAERLRALGGAVEVIPKEEVGDVLRSRWNPGAGGVVILSHMDTVWDVGTVAGRPTRIDGNLIYGVGAMDMKGGIVIALWALRALRELGPLPRHSPSPTCSIPMKRPAAAIPARKSKRKPCRTMPSSSPSRRKTANTRPNARAPEASPSLSRDAPPIPAPITPAASTRLKRWRIRSWPCRR